MPSIRKEKKRLKRQIRNQYDLAMAYEMPTKEYANMPIDYRAEHFAIVWGLSLLKFDLATLRSRSRMASFHTKMMKKFRRMPESPEKELIRIKLAEIRQRKSLENIDIRKHKIIINP